MDDDTKPKILDADEVRAHDHRYHVGAEQHGASWWPLFLIPLAFIAGWALNETMDWPIDATTNTRQEFGVGGAPLDATQLTPFPTTGVEPTDTPTPTPDQAEADIDDLLSPVVTRRTAQ